jgi:uncharacterized protein (UPF0276 family)
MRSTKANTAPFPYLGFGLGLRTDHYQDIIDQQPAIDWFEILTENYLVPGGKPLYYLDKICESYPIVMHGVSMSLGSIDPLDMDYMKQVKNLAKRVDARWISDHLCWTGIHQKNMHDLLPLPYTEEALNHVVSKIKQAQDFLGTQLLIENPSTYLTFSSSTLTEWDFMREMALAADCLILLDINNIYVSAFNHGFDPIDYLKAIPADRVQQMHLAGHTNNGDHIIDTHDHPIIDPVWKLYAQSLEYFEKVSTMIERDDHIPALSVLIQELEQAKHIAADVFQVEHAGA